MDEYVDNGGRATEARRAGHKWINIQKGAGGADDRHRLRSHHVQPLRRPALHGKAGGAITKREDGIVLIDPEGKTDLVDACYGHLVE